MKLYIIFYNFYQRIKIKRYRFYNELNALSRFNEFKKNTISFIINLSLNKRQKNVCNAILIMINRYINIIKYFFTIKKINAI